MSDTPSCSGGSNSQDGGSRAPMSDEERLALAAKLDRELDDFIDGLERKRYTDGWPEDRWQEEMEKHPFFMTSTPEAGELSPMAEGLAKLKYDPDENTPQELASNYKEDGNFNFKHKNYKLAIIGYSEGIKVNCGNAELQSSLYNNRSAAHFHLKNYRSSLSDSERALALNPSHTKARLRAATCAFEISKYDQCIRHCEGHLKTAADEKVTQLLKEAKTQKRIYERDQRKRDKSCQKTTECNKEIMNAIVKRGIKISQHANDKGNDLDLSLLEPKLPNTADSVVRLENGILLWPVLILYPEYGTTDFIRNCPENVPLMNQIEQLFPAPWDDDNKYSAESIVVYFEGEDQRIYKVDPVKELSELLAQKGFILKGGTLAFVIVVHDSEFEKIFLENTC